MTLCYPTRKNLVSGQKMFCSFCVLSAQKQSTNETLKGKQLFVAAVMEVLTGNNMLCI